MDPETTPVPVTKSTMAELTRGSFCNVELILAAHPPQVIPDTRNFMVPWICSFKNRPFKYCWVL
jgi:hypothetical protein